MNRNMGKRLIIFIDSLPYFYVRNMKFLSQFEKRIAKVMPGFGYSVNVKAEIFAGRTPDAVGYLNEWGYQGRADLRKYRFLFSLLGPVRLFPLADRIVHKMVSRLIGKNIWSIPFSYLAFFQRTGIEAYRDGFDHPSIFFDMKRLKKIGYYQFPYSRERDRLIFQETITAIASGQYDNVFIASGDLDSIAHRYGTCTKEYDRKIQELDDYLARAYDVFFTRYPDGEIIILSDHGMAEVTGGVHIPMEQKFGKPGEKTYLYFLDSTMLRIWTFNDSKRTEIEGYLTDVPDGKIMSPAERSRYGITTETFGTIIFLLNEGKAFTPSFYGRKLPRAMHGYAPELESQKGVLFSSRGLDRPEFDTISLFQFLRQGNKSDG